MNNKPTCNQQPHGQQHRDDRQPIPPGPPEREQKANPQDDTGDFACDNVKPRENQQRADDRRAQIAGREGHGAHPALHVRNASFVRVERDGFDSAAGAAGGYGMAEFVEGDDQHLLISAG